MTRPLLKCYKQLKKQLDNKISSDPAQRVLKAKVMVTYFRLDGMKYIKTKNSHTPQPFSVHMCMELMNYPNNEYMFSNY